MYLIVHLKVIYSHSFYNFISDTVSGVLIYFNLKYDVFVDIKEEIVIKNMRELLLMKWEIMPLYLLMKRMIN